MLAGEILTPQFPADSLLNVNVPNLPREQIKGYQFTRQGKRHYGENVDVRTDPRGKKYYWIGGDDMGFEPIVGSDCVAVHNGYISVTPLRADLTPHSTLEAIQNAPLPWH